MTFHVTDGPVSNENSDFYQLDKINHALALAGRKMWRTLLGVFAVGSALATTVLGLYVTPKDEHLGNSVRLLYVHPPVAWAALYLAFGLTTLCSILYLIPKTRSHFFDKIAGASAESGILFLSLTLITGSIWGHMTWGVWWTWDARLTLTAVLLVLYLGYLSVRKISGTEDSKAIRNSIAALIAAVDVPIVHFSVIWWNTLHQTASILTPSLQFKVPLSMGITMGIGFLSATFTWIWMVRVRYEISILEEAKENKSLTALIENRRMERVG